MYYLSIIFLMIIFPVCSIMIDLSMNSPTNLLQVILKWFVFWAIGIRLTTAGLRQIFQPKFTSKEILGIIETRSLILVRELGFSNLSIGMIAIISSVVPHWLLPAATAGGLFMGFAGVHHLFQSNKNHRQQFAMVSDLAIFLILFTIIIIPVFQ